MTKQEFLAMSLPYGLKVKYITDRIQHYSATKYEAEFECGKYLPIESMPILRPLSDLTKEIEHNGEKFVPIEVLGKIIEPNGEFCHDDGSYGWGTPTGGDDYQDHYLEISKDLEFEFWCGHKDEGGYLQYTEPIPFETILMLIKWHFDIAGLIEKGEAIDVNTLPENPYK